MSNNRVFITGAAGQDGAYLIKDLLDEGRHVTAMVLNDEARRLWRIYDERSPCYCMRGNSNLEIVVGDVTDAARIDYLLHRASPAEIYHLAALTRVGDSFDSPTKYADVIISGIVNILESSFVRTYKDVRIYNASTSEMFGPAVGGRPLSMASSFLPRSPYGAAKLAAHQYVSMKRGQGVWAVSGVLFNHESPLRGDYFFTKKVTNFVKKVRDGYSDLMLNLGDISGSRDWGHAHDYVRGMRMLLAADRPEDMLLGTGVSTPLEDWITMAFAEIGVDDWSLYVSTGTKKDIRRNDVKDLISDPSETIAKLGWFPTVSVKQLVHEMVNSRL